MTSFEKVYQLCKSRHVAISRLEKDLGFSNGSLKGRGNGTIPYERLEKIANYFSVNVNEIRDDEFASDSKTNNTFVLDIDALDGDKKKFAQDLINIYFAGTYADDATFELIKKSLSADLEMIKALKGKK